MKMEFNAIPIISRFVIETQINSSSNSEDDEEIIETLALSLSDRKEIPRIENYIAYTVLRMSDKTFKSHFRIDRSTADYLVDLLAIDLSRVPGSVGRCPIPVYTQILMSLWMMATPDTYRENNSTMVPIILVHGGAGDIPQSRVEGKLNGVRVAATVGQKILLQGGSALDAVEAAVVSMEKDDFFNAGFGSVLNLRGEVEMEASIMCGKDLNVGAVTLVKDFLHPISIAHKVLTDSPHSLLGGEGATIFALDKGFSKVPPESLISEHAKAALNDFLEHGEFGRTEIGKTISDVGTVGAVALDSNGHIAVATSTGGMSGKAVGRIGDTPQIGSGTYADDNIGGVSTTGHGETILKYCLAHSIIKLMECGKSASVATKIAVEGMTKRLNNTAGAITLSKCGDVGIHFSSKRLAWAYIKSNKIFYGIEHDEVLEDDYIAV